MSEGKELAAVGRADLVPVEQIKSMVSKVHQVMKDVMVDGRHYGVIPGTGSKPTLLKGGAELLGVMFRLRPEYTYDRRIDGDDLTVFSKCSLFHIETGQKIGEGNAICSTRESKYAYRTAGRKCPKCGKEAIIKGKEEYGGGWLCFQKKQGCGSKWPAGAAEIESQPQGKVPNDDMPDIWNTVSKMADKRANIAAILSATAASEVFTQDLEDMQENIAARTTTTPAAAPNTTEKSERLLETVSAEILKVRKMKTGDVNWFEIALTGGVFVKGTTDDIGLKAKTLEGKPALVEFNKKTLQVLTLRGMGEVSVDGPGDAQEPSEAEMDKMFGTEKKS